MLKRERGYLKEEKSVFPTIYFFTRWWGIYKNCKIVIEWQGHWIGFGTVKNSPCIKCYMKRYGCKNECRNYKEWMEYEQSRKKKIKKK